MSNQSVEIWYDKSFASMGRLAQRMYPNEELCRFLGNYINNLKKSDISTLSCLEVGCGSGGNLWMLSEKGMKTYGLDISSESLKVAAEYLADRSLSAEFIHSNMCDLSFFGDCSLDIVVDIFSSNCLDLENHYAFVNEVKRVLKPSGTYFVYTPSKSSDAFLNHQPSVLIDSCTLNGIYRETAPFCGNHYPFRFEHPSEFSSRLLDQGLQVKKLELISRTYSNMNEYFEFISAEFSIVDD